MIHTSLIWLAMLGLSTTAFASATSGPDIVGYWSRRDGETRISISPCGDALCAVNTWVRDPGGSEKLGDTLVMTLKPDSNSVLSGRAYDQRRDISYSMHISLTPSDMRTSGCVLLGMLCKSAEWTRIQ
jgi:uncharacterized protein (DUF2147 family)